MALIRKGIDGSGQPYTMIRDRDGTRYEYPEGKTCWSGFNDPKSCDDCSREGTVYSTEDKEFLCDACLKR